MKNIIRIIILAYLLLFSSFAIGEEGEVLQEFRIIINEESYIKPALSLDIDKYVDSGNALDNLKFTCSVIIEF